MTKDEQLKANLIVARALGCDEIDANEYSIAHMVRGEYHEFNIFTNPSDCQAAVKKLLWHGFTISADVEAGEMLSITISIDCDNPISVTEIDLETAVAAAYLALKP